MRGFGDDRLIVNLTVWTSLETLGDFVYAGLHREIMARRREWFVPMREAFQVLWWIPEGALPTVADAEERLAHLREHGPTEHAFTFRTVVAPDAAWFCPA